MLQQLTYVPAGERIFDAFTPAKMYKHKLFFTTCFTAMMFIIFFYCAAEYPVFIQQFRTIPGNEEAFNFPTACYAGTNSTYYGPRQMEHWIRSGVSHDRFSPCYCLQKALWSSYTPWISVLIQFNGSCNVHVVYTHTHTHRWAADLAHAYDAVLPCALLEVKDEALQSLDCTQCLNK